MTARCLECGNDIGPTAHRCPTPNGWGRSLMEAPALAYIDGRNTERGRVLVIIDRAIHERSTGNRTDEREAAVLREIRAEVSGKTDRRSRGEQIVMAIESMGRLGVTEVLDGLSQDLRARVERLISDPEFEHSELANSGGSWPVPPETIAAVAAWKAARGST